MGTPPLLREPVQVTVDEAEAQMVGVGDLSEVEHLAFLDLVPLCSFFDCLELAGVQSGCCSFAGETEVLSPFSRELLVRS